MASIRRQSRRRVDTRDTVAQAWDAGSPPPPEAADPGRHADVIGIVFFRWCERKPAWHGHHPHLADWLAVIGHPEIACS